MKQGSACRIFLMRSHRRLGKALDLPPEIVRKIASAPLAFQPGERWRYGLSTDVLGGIIEVGAEKSLRDFTAGDSGST